MTEPRMRMRQKGQQFATGDLESLLYAFGDTTGPALPATVRTLDEIITDFVIETCHAAALCASYSRRAKIKVEDFKFMLRRDPKKLGRVLELLFMERKLKAQRQAFRVEEAEELKRAKAEARAEERRAKRARGEEADEADEGDNATTVGGAGAEPGKKKRGRKKKQRVE